MTNKEKWEKLRYKQIDLWDWICSQIGFDKDGKELQKAIKEFVELKIEETNL